MEDKEEGRALPKKNNNKVLYHIKSTARFLINYAEDNGGTREILIKTNNKKVPKLNKKRR